MLTISNNIFLKQWLGELTLTQVQILVSVTLVCSISCQKDLYMVSLSVFVKRKMF